MQAGSTPQQILPDLHAHLVGLAGDGNGNHLPRRFIGANLLGSWRRSAVVAWAAARFWRLRFGWKEVQLGVLADAADENRVGRQRLQNGSIGVATVHEKMNRTGFAMRFGIEGLPQGSHLLGGEPGYPVL